MLRTLYVLSGSHQHAQLGHTTVTPTIQHTRGISTYLSFTDLSTNTSNWDVGIVRSVSDGTSGDMLVEFTISSDASAAINIDQLAIYNTIPPGYCDESPRSYGQTWCGWYALDCGDGSLSIQPGLTTCTVKVGCWIVKGFPTS